MYKRYKCVACVGQKGEPHMGFVVRFTAIFDNNTLTLVGKDERPLVINLSKFLRRKKYILGQEEQFIEYYLSKKHYNGRWSAAVLRSLECEEEEKCHYEKP